jgi:DNA-binding FadR family transcriptional regulator
VQERIKQYIVENQLRPGDPLPTEMVLSQQLGISRNSLREALKALETVGVVETRHGLGTYVGRGSIEPLVAGVTFNLVQSINGETRTLRELLELREILEGELVRRTIGLHTSEQLARLERLVEVMEVEGSATAIAPDVDRTFHDTLYEPLDNHTITLILHAFWDVFEAVTPQLPTLPDLEVQNPGWHRAIFQAVQRGDRDAAAAAMREQFTGIRKRIALYAEQGRQAPRN